MERIAHGYELPEALRVDGADLYFSDAMTGGVFRRRGGEIETIVPKRRGVGGIAVHRDGGVVISGRDLVHVRDGETRTLFVVHGALGLNDLIVQADGSVLVGILRMDWRKPQEGSAGEIWRVSGGAPTIVASDVTYPNGLGLAPDGRTLYAADYVGRRIYAFALENGVARTRTVLVELDGAPDGLAVDVEGGVWVATGPLGTLDRYAQDGSLTERLTPPASFVVTLCFGGDDGRDLYVATADSTDAPELGGSLFLLRSPVAGLPIARAAI